MKEQMFSRAETPKRFKKNSESRAGVVPTPGDIEDAKKRAAENPDAYKEQE